MTHKILYVPKCLILLHIVAQRWATFINKNKHLQLLSKFALRAVTTIMSKLMLGFYHFCPRQARTIMPCMIGKRYLVLAWCYFCTQNAKPAPFPASLYRRHRETILRLGQVMTNMMSQLSTWSQLRCSWLKQNYPKKKPSKINGLVCDLRGYAWATWVVSVTCTRIRPEIGIFKPYTSPRP